ncbi:hypothetical protein JNL27_08305 [bacterium]|nr:hypothetical protein [bacterium]
MKLFIKQFFEINGSEVRESRNRISVKLSDELREYFNLNELQLVFDAKDVDEKSELVTHGSYVLNTIYNYLQDRGGKIVSRLDERYQPTRDELLNSIKLDHGKVTALKSKKEKVVDILFNFKVTYLSDEKLEDIFTLGVDGTGAVFESGEYYTNAVMKDVVPLQQKGSIELSRKDLEIQFRECLKAASERAQEYGKNLQNEILKRLHRNVSRIKGYYTAQIQELHRNQPSYEEKRIHLERENELKLKEEIDNHKLRIVLKLLSYHIIERAEIRISAKLAALSSGSDAMLEMVYDPYLGEIDYGSCPVCQSNMERIILGDDGKIGCSHCSFVCSTCKKQFSDLQHAAACVVCSDPLCSNCQTGCHTCHQPVCDKHHRVCAVGDETICQTCLKTCCVCRKDLCSDHTFECHATKDNICFEHRVICNGCRKIYSPRYVQQLRKNEKICPNCKTPF